MGPDGELKAADGEVMVVMDGGGTILAWSSEAYRLTGYQAEELVGAPMGDMLTAPFRAAIGRHSRSGKPWTGTVSFRHRDGHPLDVTVRAWPLSGSDAPVWLFTTAPERSETNPQADVLKEWTLAQLPIALQICDSRGRVVAVNEAFAAGSGIPEEQLVGLGIAEREAGRTFDDAKEIPELAEKAVRTGRTQYHQIFARAPGEGHDRHWSTFVLPLRDPTGQVRGVTAGVQDTTEEYRAHRRLALVNQAGIRIGSTLDIYRTAEELAAVSVDGFADLVLVDVLDAVLGGQEEDVLLTAVSGESTFRRVAQRSVLRDCPETEGVIGGEQTYPVASSPAQALITGFPHRAATTSPFGPPDWRKDDAEHRVNRHGIHASLAVPLRARGTTLGLVQFFRHRTSEPFDDEDVLLAQEISARAALCIDNARRYTHQRNTAITLQHSLLPQSVPNQSAVEVAFRYMPAGSRAGVGGDWFDVIPLSGARVALVVGDVVGHGIHASATMGRLRTAVRTLADVDLAPDELLTHLDDLVIRLDTGNVTAPGEIHATCLYAVYDPTTRQCSVASAGHVPPAVVTPDGVATFLDLPIGPPLGVGGLPFETAELQMEEGSLLALCTDGLIEASDRDIDTGLDVMKRVLAEPTRPLEQTCDDLLAALLPPRPTDDVALLLARTRALDGTQVCTWDVPDDPAAVRDARARAGDQLTRWGMDHLAFTTELVVSELVTNAVRYGHAPIQLRLILDTALICEVSDASNTAPHLRRARVFDEGGRGLLLVAQLTERWGTRQTPTGKVIWAEQTVSTGDAPQSIPWS